MLGANEVSVGYAGAGALLHVGTSSFLMAQQSVFGGPGFAQGSDESILTMREPLCVREPEAMAKTVRVAPAGKW